MIAGSYQVGMSLSCPVVTEWTQSPLNPAVALAEITFATFDGHVDEMHWAWIFLVFGFGGSILAVIVFEYVFKNAQNTVIRDEEIMEEEDAEK